MRTSPPVGRSAASTRARTIVALVLTLISTTFVPACGHVRPKTASSATAMGSWPQWYDLSPLVDVAKSHAPKPTIDALEAASKLLRQDKPLDADRRLAEVAGTDGRHWIAVARADLAALHFSVCIRGVAWRLENRKPGALPTERRMDFSTDARIRPGDVSVEALLTNLDGAVAEPVPALVTQARIARARVTAFASRCPPNDDVQQVAERMLEADLATLAAEAHLTPDLAFVWGGIQMSRYSSAAARPFLLAARDGGFDDPAVLYMLAVIALDQRDLAQAETLAQQADRAYARLDDKDQQAQMRFLHGEIAHARKDPTAARRHYQSALALVPTHVPALLAITKLEAQRDDDHGRDFLHANLRRLLLDGPLDEEKARVAAANAEALVIMIEDPHLAQVGRDALLLRVESDDDPMRRGLRYFFAATLEVRLREYEVAEGHAILARDEFEASGLTPPVNVQAFLQQLAGG